MPRYIDADAINLERVSDTICQWQAQEAIDDTPTADVVERKIGKCISGKRVSGKDVVEVIRCKECSYHELDGDGDDWCVWSGNNIKPTDFCSNGERRDDA